MGLFSAYSSLFRRQTLYWCAAPKSSIFMSSNKCKCLKFAKTELELGLEPILWSDDMKIDLGMWSGYEIWVCDLGMWTIMQESTGVTFLSLNWCSAIYVSGWRRQIKSLKWKQECDPHVDVLVQYCLPAMTNSLVKSVHSNRDWACVSQSMTVNQTFRSIRWG